MKNRRNVESFVRKFFRVLVTIWLVLLTLRIYGAPHGNQEFAQPFREAINASFEGTIIGWVLFHGMRTLLFLAAAYWLWFLVRMLRDRGGVLQFLEDSIFVVGAAFANYLMFGFAMAHNDANRVWLYSLGCLVIAVFWTANTIVRSFEA